MVALPYAMASGCLDDLPDAIEPTIEGTVCPPPAEAPANQCLDVLLNQSFCGCVPPEGMACLTGPRGDCSCTESSKCKRSEEEEACYPTGVCPDAVVNQVSPDAQCIRLDPSAITGPPFDDQCVCGCTSCAAECDGTGPIIGLLYAEECPGADGQPEFPTPIIVGIDDVLPAAGRMGVYVRYRGITTASISISNQLERFVPYQLSSSQSGGFQEVVLFDNPAASSASAGFSAPFDWADETSAPDTILILHDNTANEDGRNDAISLVEIDCIVPFWVP